MKLRVSKKLGHRVSDFSRCIEKPTKNLTPFPTPKGAKFKVSLFLGERFRERFSKSPEKSPKGAKFKVSLFLGERFRERFSKSPEKSPKGAKFKVSLFLGERFRERFSKSPENLDRVQSVRDNNLTSSLKKKNYSWLLACGFWVLVSNSLAYPAFSANLTPKPSALAERENIKGGVKSLCSEQNLETLTIQLLQDLPSYTNRVSQRARRLSRSSDIYSYILVAGKPEFTPLPLNLEEYSADAPKSSASGVEQVFFTTLERQYIGKKAVELQEFHWLLLTKTKSGWQVVMMFSQTGSYSGQQPLSPPRDSSNGTVAQGVKTWLRDCQAGSVRPENLIPNILK